MRYSIVLIPETDEGGFSVVPLLPGCYTQGDTVEAAVQNAKDAIQVHLKGLEIDDEDIPIEDSALILTQVDVETKVRKQQPLKM